MYVDAYKLAADALAERASEDRGEIDALIYPLVHLYRHHLELALKTLIVIGREYAEEPRPDFAHHKLGILWRDARRYMQMFSAVPDPEHLDAMGELLSELDQLDPASFAFRYPVTKNGGAVLSDVRRINVRHFAETAGRMSRFLDDYMVAMDLKLDMKQEHWG